jgi:predicted 2-oxoglutarate/Fe(II)-dependent dioxygenase YbiX
MKGEWCYFKSYIDRETCNFILKEGLKLPAEDASVGRRTVLVQDHKMRRSKVRFIQSKEQNFEFLFDLLWKTAVRANNDFFNLHITRLQYLQLAEYDSIYRGEYKAHHDVFWMNNDPDFHRKLTAVIQLSDPGSYEGGNLEFVETTHFPPANEIREQGTIIFFPALFLHRATPVTKGIRYSISAWFEGPKWR